MTRSIPFLALVAVLSVVAGEATAQTFIPQTYAIPGDTNYRMTDSQGRSIIGRAQNSGNMGLPTRDTYGSGRGSSGWNSSTGFGQRRDANGAAIDWRGNTIYRRGSDSPQARQYQYRWANQRGYAPGVDTAQLQQSIQQFSQAVQQLRQQRLRQSGGAAAANGTLFSGGRRW